VPGNATFSGRFLSVEQEHSWCTPEAWVLKEYCALQTLNKVLTAPGDCSANWYWHGALDTDEMALKSCRQSGKWGCHVVDRQGDACFHVAEVRDWAQKHFKNYCAATTPKSFFMKPDGNQVWWLTDEGPPTQQQCPQCLLYDRNGGKCPCDGPGDMRCKLQACVQYQPYWCWATTVSIVAGYYFPQRYPNTEGDGPNCRGVQCRIVGQIKYPNNPDKCCQDKDSCFDHDGSVRDITTALEMWTQMPWKPVKVPAHASIWGTHAHLLMRVLYDGHPVIMDVTLTTGEGHVVLIGGTDGNGNYYVHDPLNLKGKGSFQVLPWSGLLRFQTTTTLSTIYSIYVPSHFHLQAATCKSGDVRLVDGRPDIFWDGAWIPICGHHFWDDSVGAEIVCSMLGGSGGTVKNLGATYESDAMPVGRCQMGNLLTQCTMNEGSPFGNLDYNGVQCRMGEEVAIRIDCQDPPPMSASCKDGSNEV